MARERDCGKRKEKAMYFSLLNGTFSLNFGQGTRHFHFERGPEKYVAGSEWQSHDWNPGSVYLKYMLLPDRIYISTAGSSVRDMK